jgi:hypothetical protein
VGGPGPRLVVFHLHQDPAFVLPPAGPGEGKAAQELLALQKDGGVTLLQSGGHRHHLLVDLGGVLVGPDVPDDDRARPILALGDRALKVDVVEGVVLGGDREALFSRVDRGAFGDGPRLEAALHLQPEIVMERLRPVLLDGEPGLSLRLFLASARGLAAGLGEVPLLAVGFELIIFGHLDHLLLLCNNP